MTTRDVVGALAALGIALVGVASAWSDIYRDRPLWRSALAAAARAYRGRLSR